MSDLHKSDPDSPWADELEFVRDYARRNDGYALVQPVVDFINAHLTPQIIRSKTELVTLDPDAVLIDSDGEVMDAGRMQKNLCGFGHMSLYSNPFPAVVVTPATQVRAAREALEEATE